MKQSSQNGFTLIEVLITMFILLGLVVAVSSMLRSSIDVKQALSRQSRITHRLSLASHRITHDIEHAFITGLNDEHRGGANRRFKTIFKIDKGGETDKLYLTIAGNPPLRKDGKDGDAAYVVYEVREAKDAPNRKHLYRGSAPLVLEDLKTDPPMRLLVRNIKSLRVLPWNGDDWSNDRWDSSRGEWRDRLPQMVRVEVETWGEDDYEVTTDTAQDGRNDNYTETVKTIVRVQNSRFMKETRQPNSSVKWY